MHNRWIGNRSTEGKACLATKEGEACLATKEGDACLATKTHRLDVLPSSPLGERQFSQLGMVDVDS